MFSEVDGLDFPLGYILPNLFDVCFDLRGLVDLAMRPESDHYYRNNEPNSPCHNLSALGSFIE